MEASGTNPKPVLSSELILLVGWFLLVPDATRGCLKRLNTLLALASFLVKGQFWERCKTLVMSLQTLVQDIWCWWAGWLYWRRFKGKIDWTRYELQWKSSSTNQHMSNFLRGILNVSIIICPVINYALSTAYFYCNVDKSGKMPTHHAICINLFFLAEASHVPKMVALRGYPWPQVMILAGMLT